MRRKNGFSLVELMVVVAIIGILAGISVPRFGMYTTKAKLAEVHTLTASLKEKVADYYRQNGEFPKNNKAAGIPGPTKLLGHYIAKVELESGALHVTLREKKLVEKLRGKTVSIRPLIVPGSPASPISWSCGTRDTPEGMKPVGKNKTNAPSELLPPGCH